MQVQAKVSKYKILLLVFAYVFTSIGVQVNAEDLVIADSKEAQLQTQTQSEDLPYVEGEVLVKYKSNKINLSTFSGTAKALKFAKSKSLEKEEDMSKINTSLLTITDDSTVEEVVAELEADSNVEYAQPNFQYHTTNIETDDTYKNLLWGLDNTGQFANFTAGIRDKDIDAPEAWSINEGTNEPVIIAIIDLGVAYNHPDLAANMWDGANCKDENGNLLGNCLHGYDYEDNDQIPLPATSTHGTHIAGTIGAIKNNNKGIIGVAPNVKIMAIKSALTTEEIIKGINFAKQNGAKVINASWGGAEYDPAIKDAIDQFTGLFIASAGNCGDVNTFLLNKCEALNQASFPANYDSPNIISVAATDQADNLASFSSYGSTHIDVGAPGTNVYSTVADFLSIMSEDFDSQIPDTWIKTGNWGTKMVAIGMLDLNQGHGKGLYGDVNNAPYASNANSTATSPTYNLSSSTSAATISFFAKCDTEYTVADWSDYLQLEYSADGVNFSPAVDPVFGFPIRWDESYLDSLNNSPPSDTGAAEYYFQNLNIPPQYLTSNFKFQFRWVTNDSDNNHIGCLVDDISIAGYSDGSDEQYGYLSGTSMAAPHVAGLAALILGYKPELSYAEVKDIILNTGDPVASLAGKTFSGRRINAYNALHFLAPAATLSSIAITNPATKLSYNTGDSLDLTGLEVTGTYSDATTRIEPITADNITGFDSSVAAVGQVLTITVGDQTVTYTVDIIHEISTAKAITSFTTPQGNGVIDGTNILISVPFATDVTALVPTIAISPYATVAPASGIPQDFTNPVSYTVTAEDLSTQEYIVTVDVAEISDNDLLTADKDALTDEQIKGSNPDLQNITLSLTNPLPTTGSINGSTITWASSTPSIVSNDGQTINRPLFINGDAVVTLTATLTKGAFTQTKDFILTITKQPADNTAPTVSKLGDNSYDYILYVGNTSLVFSEVLSSSSQTAVQNALTSGADKSLTYSWTSATLNISATENTTFANDVSVSVSDLSGNTASLLLIDSNIPPTTNTSSGGSGGGGSSNSSSGSSSNKNSDDEDSTVELQSTSVATPFTDIVGHWAATYIDNLRLKGIVNGKFEGTFAPDAQITRAELVKIVVNLYQLNKMDTISVKPFSDVEIDTWYATYIEAAKTAGVLEGYSDGTFKPNQAISRVEALKILLVASRKDLAAEVSTFTDTAESDWYAMYINYAKAKGLIQGYADGSFGPNKQITRGEFAKLASLISE